MRYTTFLLLLVTGSTAQAQSLVVSSPAKKVVITIANSVNLSYSVVYNGKTVVFDSPLGFEFKDEPPMGAGLLLLSRKEQGINENWIPVVKSKHNRVSNHYNELQLAFKETAGLQRRLDMYFRAYDDGAAFRYKLYRSGKPGNRQITKELTGFRLAGHSKAWVADFGKYTSSQESDFLPRFLNDMTPATIAGLPFLVEADTTAYVAITEANIDNYAGFYVGADSSTIKTDTVTLVTKLSPLPGEKEDGVKLRFDGSQYTPWRVIMLAAAPGKLAESEIIQNLNEPCVLRDVSWIKPGMSAWDHWWSGEVKVDNTTIKQYIDLAAAEHWPYMVIDWQWYGPFNKPEADITHAAPQLDMPGLLQYAKSKNVRCWLWLYSSDANRNNNFEHAFPLYEQWGIAGVKIDFMDRDDQEMVNWYHQVIKAAAAHHLMVDFHGAYKPDGIIRTWPNMITREGVMGEEYSKFSNRVTPEHNTTLPFTRMLAGGMDYTPGGFLNVTKEQFRQGTPTVVMNTRSAELSKFVIYESPFTVYCDDPSHILGQPGADFLKIVPTVWDDIKVLGGYPGEYIVVAKRTGQKWFIGAMTNSRERKITISLDFLAAGKYTLESWADAADAGTNPQHLQKAKQPVSAATKLTINMAIGGGYTACISPSK